MNEIVPVNGKNQIQRQEFGAVEIENRAETAAVAAAEQARAVVEARSIMALRRPRDLDQARVKLLKDACRPAFAAVAVYRRPVGDGKAAEGPSIRFAEAAMRAMGNIYVEAPTVYDDDAQRIIRVSASDLESNVTFSKDVTLKKTMERKTLKDGDTPISARTNSQGRTTYLLPATEDALRVKEAAEVSKAVRTLILRLVPGDLVDEALRQVRSTLADKDARDPDGARKDIADAFADLGVMPAALKEYLGHDLATCSPAELADLRGVYAAIRDGESTWHEVLSNRGKADSEPSKSTREKVKAAAEKAREETT